MLSVTYVECYLWWVSHESLICWVPFYLISLCWMSLRHFFLVTMLWINNQSMMKIVMFRSPIISIEVVIDKTRRCLLTWFAICEFEQIQVWVMVLNYLILVNRINVYITISLCLYLYHLSPSLSLSLLIRSLTQHSHTLSYFQPTFSLWVVSLAHLSLPPSPSLSL